ncbi:MAG: glycosyltransferase [Burkholderiales bacterium]
MKIALISADATPVDVHEQQQPPGDRAHYVAHLARELGAAGHLVDVFTRRSDLWALPVVAIAPNVRVISVPAGPPHFVPPEALLAHMDDFAGRIAGGCAGHGPRYDVAHASSVPSGIAALRLKQRCGLPFAATFDGLDRAGRAQAFDRFPADRARVEAQLAAAADRIVALNSQERDRLIALYGTSADRIELIPPGVDTSAFRPGSRGGRAGFGLRADAFVILQVTRFLPGEGVETTIRALARLRRDCGARLVICGRSDDADPSLSATLGRLRALAAAERVTGQVTFVYAGPPAARRDAYCAADVVVATPSCAGCAEPPLEAMACGVPVVGSNLDPIRVAVRDRMNGYLVPPDDPDALADRLARLHGNPELARAYGRGGILRVRTAFTWYHAATAVACVFAGVLAPHRARLAAAASGA